LASRESRIRYCITVLIYSASIILDAFKFIFLAGFVIRAEVEDLAARALAHDGPRISHIGHITDIVDDDADHRTAAGPVDVAQLLLLFLRELKEERLRLPEAPSDGQTGVLREVLVLDDELVQVVSEVLRAFRAPVPIIDPEIGAFGPVTEVFLALGLHDVEDDGDPVFVVVANDALVRICSVGSDGAVAFARELGWLVVTQHQRGGVDHG